jgi:hypothetical protein
VFAQVWIAETEEIAAILAYNVDFLPMASDLKTQFFQGIAEDDQASQGDAIATLPDQANVAAWDLYLPTPGVQFAKVGVDLATRRAKCFVCSFSQVRCPEHRHADKDRLSQLALP